MPVKPAQYEKQAECRQSKLSNQRAHKDAQQRTGHNLNGRMADELLEAFLVKHKAIARQTIQQVIEHGCVFAR